ncbi:hypothetical protein EZJ49_10285 [Bdellovibrio bacteriovorus]|uniref:hypothetical protein n=1 Tax=Bdellovibrio bacteriovorus TaxID=959 RepID=UPI0021D39163|nr:hypothetical protein [Bdellovibrio bacteriovorus]UXR63463.1 hypothetical protein EZJ49_10285 [Bdellovibrio bacteriovorus]
MNPRLKSSKKWTAFPKEYSEQILGVFKENFAQYLGDAELIVEGRIYQEEIALRVGYLEEGRLAQANFEVSMNYSQEQQDAITRIHNCVDAAASMMMEYLENDGEVDFPYTWKEVPFQGKKIYLRFSTENSSLEAEANKLLGLNEDEMLHDEEQVDEDALSRAEQSEELSPPRDDEDYTEEESEDTDEDDSGDNKGPKMFSGKSKKSLH